MATKVKKVKKVKKPVEKSAAKTPKKPEPKAPAKKSKTLPSTYKYLLARLKNVATGLVEDKDDRKALKAELLEADTYGEVITKLKSFGLKASQVDEILEEFFSAEVTRQR